MLLGIKLYYSYFPGLNNPFFIRGGRFDNNSNAGLFTFNRSDGNSNYRDGFRPVLVATSIHKILKEINLRWVIFKDITERKANSCSITIKMKKVCRKENEKNSKICIKEV